MNTGLFVLAMAISDISIALAKHWGVYKEPPSSVGGLLFVIFCICILLDLKQ